MDGNFRDGTDRSQLAFEGRENDDVTVFLRELKRVANAQGRQRDNDWLVDTFEMCLAGPALRWYSLLDDDVQSDFKRLRLAALQRFTPIERVPEPPAAVPLRPSEPASSAADLGICRIKIYDLAGKMLGFCGMMSPSIPQRCPLVTTSAEGIIVRYRAQAGGFCLIEAVFGLPRETDKYLGIGRYLREGSFVWVLSFCDRDAVRQAYRQESNKELSSRVWSLDPSTLEISANWIESSNEPTQLELRANPLHKLLWL